MRGKRRFESVLPLPITEGSDVFGADSRDGLQQELGEIAEGNGVFAGDVSLGHEEKCLGEGAVDVGGGGEVRAERFELWSLQGSALGAAFLLCVVSAKRRAPISNFFILNRRKLILLVDVSPRWVDFRRITTLASVGKGEFAARGEISDFRGEGFACCVPGDTGTTGGFSFETTDLKNEGYFGPSGGSFTVVI
jgi:hypothetical protein